MSSSRSRLGSLAIESQSRFERDVAWQMGQRWNGEAEAELEGYAARPRSVSVFRRSDNPATVAVPIAITTATRRVIAGRQPATVAEAPKAKVNGTPRPAVVAKAPADPIVVAPPAPRPVQVVLEAPRPEPIRVESNPAWWCAGEDYTTPPPPPRTEPKPLLREETASRFDPLPAYTPPRDPARKSRRDKRFAKYRKGFAKQAARLPAAVFGDAWSAGREESRQRLISRIKDADSAHEFESLREEISKLEAKAAELARKREEAAAARPAPTPA